MQGTGGLLNYEKGIQLINSCADNGNYNCKSDLAFFYFKGMGVEKDIQKAFDLLTEANNLIIEKTGIDQWEKELKMMKKHLEK